MALESKKVNSSPEELIEEAKKLMGGKII